MSCSSVTAPGSRTAPANERSSSSRVATIWSAFSASGPSGSRPLTLRAFTRATSPPRRGQGAVRAGSPPRSPLAPPRLPRERLVAAGLLRAQLVLEAADAACLLAGERVRDSPQFGDVHVG